MVLLHSLCQIHAVLAQPRSVALHTILKKTNKLFVQKSCTRTNKHHSSSSGEHTAESYAKLQFVDLAGSECIGKPEAQDYCYYYY